MVKPALTVPYSFNPPSGEYSLVVRATWEGPVSVFYSGSLGLNSRGLYPPMWYISTFSRGSVIDARSSE